MNALLLDNTGIITSRYIPILEDKEEIILKPNYEEFARVTAMAVDSVEKEKFGYRTFIRTIDNLINRYHILEEDLNDLSEEQKNLKQFALLVVKEILKDIEDTYENRKQCFQNIQTLVDYYGIERPETKTYPGRQLVRKY